jgi:hypothetical protein
MEEKKAADLAGYIRKGQLKEVSLSEENEQVNFSEEGSLREQVNLPEEVRLPEQVNFSNKLIKKKNPLQKLAKRFIGWFVKKPKQKKTLTNSR